ncbi:hypothetical protein T484DRAFT_1916469 [Baffinella frigidus]|nr:hypothetical protein T484DRAFT_1916469 [Cryptophyta sp. CCMP2293]
MQGRRLASSGGLALVALALLVCVALQDQGGARGFKELAERAWADDKLVEEAHAAVENNKGLGSKAVLKAFLAAKLEEGPSVRAKGSHRASLKVVGGGGAGAAAAHKPETRQEKENSEARQDELSDCEPFCGPTKSGNARESELSEKGGDAAMALLKLPSGLADPAAGHQPLLSS